ncbi:hypothetical protein, partial [Streptomyces sp. NPDC005385]|uniref:hypothetical protein n=1 Tax=Streptomyces sp. NPDC005385 TaxID=3157039 RepID=UPI0033BF170A
PLTIDHVNPERPWPQIELLREQSSEAGFELRAGNLRVSASSRKGWNQPWRRGAPPSRPRRPQPCPRALVNSISITTRAGFGDGTRS